MQSRSPPLVRHLETDSPPPVLDHTTTQHGRADCNTPPSPSSGSSDDGGVEIGAGVGVEVGIRVSPRASYSEDSRKRSLTSHPRPAPSGLSSGSTTPHTPLPLSRNRIAEYENASRASPSPHKAESLGFEVIKKARRPGDKRSPILDLPNGS